MALSADVSKFLESKEVTHEDIRGVEAFKTSYQLLRARFASFAFISKTVKAKQEGLSVSNHARIIFILKARRFCQWFIVKIHTI